MNENESNLNINNIIKDKSAASVALATFILLILSFFVIRYFNNNENIEDQLNGDGLSTVVEESSDQENGDSEEQEGEEGTSEESASSEEQQAMEGGVGGAYPEGSFWAPNDLEPNSMEGDSYEVQQGDTLWEVAEAFYGNGYNWQEIANANDISYLPNGNPLIVPGQTLTVPSLN